jgi:hypothetical protein
VGPRHSGLNRRRVTRVTGRHTHHPPSAKLAFLLRIARPVIFAFLAAALIAPLSAIDPERDFSGKWFFDARRSNTEALLMPPEQTLTVVQQDVAVRCSSTGADGAAVQWSYLLDGTETRSRIGDETRTSVAKWEGAALLINTQVRVSSPTGPRKRPCRLLPLALAGQSE